MNCIAVIPARGGSKGIPGKNLKRVAGKPLLAHTIKAALGAACVNRVIVSTDDQRIAWVARQYGADVIERPAAISGDSASSEATLLHALDHLKDSEGFEPDILIFLQCTSPLTTSADIDRTVQTLLDSDADCAFTAAPFHGFVWREDDGQAIGINHDKNVRPMRQEKELQYLETGAVYVMRVGGFKQAKHRFFGKTVIHVVPPERSHQIDDPADLEVAEVFVRQRQLQEAHDLLPERTSALVLDFDGVFTDNKVHVFQDGMEAVICDRSDGWGLARLKEKGLPILVLSTEENPVVVARCGKLGIECRNGLATKEKALAEWLEERGIDAAEVVFVGNDVNDLSCMKMVGCSVAPSDAHPEILRTALLVLSSAGGNGVLRELADLILERIGS